MNLIGSAMASLRRRPVRVRLAIFSGVLTAVILVGFAAVVGRLVSDRLQNEFRDELQRTASGIALSTSVFTQQDRRLGVCLRVDSPGTTGCLPLEQAAMANDAEIRIVDGSGAYTGFGSTAPPALGPPEPGEMRELDDGLRVIDFPIPTNTSLAGPLFLQYARSPASVDSTIERLWLFLGGGVLIGSLLAGFAGMTVANRAMAPIASLTGTAREIASTRDPSLRIPEPESDDEVAELARTLDQMLRELDAARTETELTIRRQREFVADASHELRTPLTSILANLELLEASLLDGPEDDQAATRSALRSSRRMSRLVADLLIIARADAGRQGERVDCDLSRIAREAFEEVQPVAEGHGLKASIEPGARLHGNPDELHRMVLNLLENSIRHTPAGTSVELTLTRRPERALLEVSDDGPGLPAGMEDEVFGRFVRGGGPADRSGSSGDSTGLGLAIVRAVALAHGGTVRAGEGPAGGALFTAELPTGESSKKIERTHGST